MRAQSFESWRIPAQIAGLVMIEDLTRGPRAALHERHTHAEVELHLFLRGRATFMFRSERLELGEASMLWVPPRWDHFMIDSTRDLLRYNMLLRVALVRRVVPATDVGRLLRPSQQTSLVRRLAGPDARALARLLGSVRERQTGPVTLHNAAVGYALACAWTAFEAAPTELQGAALHPAVARAVRLLREEATNPSMAELAHACRVSESYLSKLFSQQLGVSVTEYRNRCRVQRFVELFGDGTTQNLTEAAFGAGFGSYPQFHRVFTRVMGYGPAEHRRRAALGTA